MKWGRIKMQKILSSLVVILSCLSNLQAGATERHSKFGIKVDEELRGMFSVNGHSTCRGTLPESAKMDRVGLTQEDLNTGVECIIADFDGNGVQDFLIYGPLYRLKDHLALVIFNGDKGILRTQVLSGADQCQPFSQNDRERKNYAKFKGAYGLINFAAGDMGEVFFYDKKTGLFKEEKYVYPPHYLEGD